MESATIHVIDVSESTIRALKIVSLIVLMLLIVQIAKSLAPSAAFSGVAQSNPDLGRWKNNPSNKSESESQKKYWKEVEEEMEREFPSAIRGKDGKKSSYQKKMQAVVSDKNIDIKKKSNPTIATDNGSKKEKPSKTKKKNTKGRGNKDEK